MAAPLNRWHCSDEHLEHPQRPGLSRTSHSKDGLVLKSASTIPQVTSQSDRDDKFAQVCE